MKKILILAITLSVAGFSCKATCEIDKPNHKPVDWENYNDVHTVYWNYTGECSDFTLGHTGETIKMYGWIFHPENAYPGDFPLLSDSLYAGANNPKCAMILIRCIIEEEERLKMKFDTSNLMKKCYVTGELVIVPLETMRCCITAPHIVIMNADDVYFE